MDEGDHNCRTNAWEGALFETFAHRDPALYVCGKGAQRTEQTLYSHLPITLPCGSSGLSTKTSFSTSPRDCIAVRSRPRSFCWSCTCQDSVKAARRAFLARDGDLATWGDRAYLGSVWLPFFFTCISCSAPIFHLGGRCRCTARVSYTDGYSSFAQLEIKGGRARRYHHRVLVGRARRLSCVGSRHFLGCSIEEVCGARQVFTKGLIRLVNFSFR